MLDNGYDVSLGKWSPWRGRFAWFPKQLQIRNSVNQGSDCSWSTDTRWCWLATYYERTKQGIVGASFPMIIYDHETDIFGVIKKP